MTNLYTKNLGYQTSKKIRKARKKMVKRLIKAGIDGNEYPSILNNAESYIYTNLKIVNITNDEQAKKVDEALRSIGFNTYSSLSNNYHYHGD